jgi:ABC-type oligopeptide transport system ATPase subunit
MRAAIAQCQTKLSKARRTIEEPLRLHFKRTSAKRRERLNEVISDVGLGTDLMERYHHELFDGQRHCVQLVHDLGPTDAGWTK